jgi:5'-3' exonuclease
MKNASVDDRLGMIMHQMFRGVATVWGKFNADHCLFALEGESWRKQIYPEYKLNRKIKALKKTESEVEMDELFLMAANSFVEYIQKRTAVSVIQAKDAEADDVIATFIMDRPNDIHIIVSTDTDFYQLIGNNVTIYDPMKGNFITNIGVYDEKFQPVIDKKTNKQKHLGDPEYILFKKIIRGDASDNIKSAYPRIPEKSTKNRVGITEVFSDRHSKQFAWNTVMLSEWVDHKNQTHIVKDDYVRNKILIDFTEIPESVRNQIRSAIEIEKNKKIEIRNIGFHFLQFCGKWNLVNIQNNSEYYTDFLRKPYV